MGEGNIEFFYKVKADNGGGGGGAAFQEEGDIDEVGPPRGVNKRNRDNSAVFGKLEVANVMGSEADVVMEFGEDNAEP